MEDTMLKPLSRIGIIELGIEQLFAGKIWAYTPVISENGFALGIAVANEAGYNRVPEFWCHGDSYEVMSDHCNALNRERGLDDDIAARIVCSTFAAQN
jgi:hypothetical protein